MSATNSAISSPSRPSQSPSRQQATSQDVYDLIRGILYQQSPAKGDAFDAPSFPGTRTAAQDGQGGYPSASRPTIVFSGLLEGAMTEGSEGGRLLERCIGLGQPSDSWNSWNEPGGSGLDMRSLEAKMLDFQGPDNASRFDPALVDFDLPLSRDPLRVEHEQEHAEAIPQPYTFDYSYLPAEVPVQATDHALPSSRLEVPDTNSRTARFWPVPPFGMALTTGMAPSTGMAYPAEMSYPLLEAGPSGLPEDVLVPSTPPPQTVDLVQQSWLMGDRKRLLTEEQDTSDAPRLAKKHKGPRVETQSTPPRRTSARKNRARKLVAAPSLPVAGPSNLRSAAADQDAASVYESDPNEDTDRDRKDYAPDGTGTATTRTKRARRTKDQIKAVTRTDLPKIHCPVEGCETMFDPLTHDANRDHLERHYETELQVGVGVESERGSAAALGEEAQELVDVDFMMNNLMCIVVLVRREDDDAP
ncbi:uncharacterized protein TRAVEDRAFT_22364 [Trametes versicolor FP-101664 SS1]|uniref:uncharacterized protein n=1 Tax=Trametes versicolor (strain FP-101664) TaxID=717944 RepID=UPI000462283C|nr:uncharacterized protein TRAVEDRAFT_22364 [Trametes versicolor FP-101664 SS1]EIW55969.1 hypothetical protein TRAVEDRAFT_22364 [Trametes versicolor FP-101664 SS1]